MRAPPLLLLLLMAAAGLAVSPLARLNPWLSACDLEEGESGGACSSGAAACGGGGAGDTLSPHDVADVCAMSSSDRARRLGLMRLRTCCERSPITVLDPETRDHDLVVGGTRCEETLMEVIRLDKMVARVHCDFITTLERYDCDQPYSIHTCRECEDKYRQWACSTLIPFWVMDGAAGAASAALAGASTGAAGGAEAARRRRRAPAGLAARWRARHLERVGHLDRRRGGGVVGRWVRAAAAGPGRPFVRLKPCLRVCQQVEQFCPYFLPADRAPAYPTQYAGEPTFLCLDPRIPETGGQANKSNYGSDDCCYWYCNEPGSKKSMLCYSCSASPEAAGPRPPAEHCPPVDERVPSCAVPYQAAPAAVAATSAAAHPCPVLPLLIVLAVLAHSRTRRTATVPIVNKCDSGL